MNKFFKIGAFVLALVASNAAMAEEKASLRLNWLY